MTKTIAVIIALLLTVVLVLGAAPSRPPMVSIDEGLILRGFGAKAGQPTVTITPDLIYVYDPDMPEPYREVTMLMNAENIAKVIPMSPQLRFIETVIQAVMLREAERVKREQPKTGGYVDPKLPQAAKQ
jgi:hypothetical protein